MRQATLLLASTAGLFLTACSTTTSSTTPDQFTRADVNADGSLTRDESIHYLVATNFATRDANKDGILTKAEWNPTNDAAAAKAFALRDANKDGQVSLDEALSYAKKKGGYDKDFTDADTDKNGLVSRAEATAYVGSKEGPIR